MAILRPFIESRSLDGKFILTEKGRLAKEIQRQYGDVFMQTRNGGFAAVEVKAERENNHGNLFLETWSNRKWFTQGWMYTLDADILLYHFIREDELFVMSFPELRRWAWWHAQSRARLWAFPERQQRQHEQMNDTWGVCAPIVVLSRELKTFRQFVASTGEPVIAGESRQGMLWSA